MFQNFNLVPVLSALENVMLALSYAGIDLVFLNDVGMSRSGSGHTSLIGSIGPVATIYLAHVFLGESVSLLQIAGSSLVLAGVLVISLSAGRRAT